MGRRRESWQVDGKGISWLTVAHAAGAIRHAGVPPLARSSTVAGWRLVTGSSPGVRAVCAAHRPCRPSGPSSVHHCCVPREKKKEANGSRDRLSFVGSLRGLGGGGAGGIDVKATVKSHVETGQSSRNSSPIPTSLVRNPYSSIRTRDSSSLRPRLIDSYGRIRGKKKRIPVVYAFNLVVDSSRDTILTNGSFHFRYIF